MSKYVFGKTVSLGFDQAVEAVTQALAKEGFGVLTEIDVAATLKKKLGIERAPYKILGACNPQFAALLPCNVVVRQDTGGKTVVEFMDPNAVLDLAQHTEIGEIAAQVRTRLERVMAAL